MMNTTNNEKPIARRLSVLLFTVFAALATWADDVTPEQALQQAQDFVNQRVAAKGGRKASAADSRLTAVRQVSGLYVFNVADQGGFVIIANDDVATPVLGYSDSGSIDPDNIPDNMRAWLQGYADEIAWAKEHQLSLTSDGSVASASPRRAQSAVKTPVTPLLSTQWNQDAPYNYLCPYYLFDDQNYYYSTTAAEGYEHCATGCVATAMAQLMYYHKWPTAETAAIPAYQWGRGGVYLPNPDDTNESLPATTFDWAHMKTTYDGSETDVTATAVATLMKYCGYSVQMNYGPESSSNTAQVANALKTYYRYNSSTTQLAVRSYYTYQNWIELIYHEVKNSRPVVYGGSSSGGGHEFVVDGYQGEDYFHINWGWGGASDDYFKLSALNPYDQGIGGSSTRDGFRYQQDAVIGVQKPTESGTVADVHENAYDLTLKSMTLSSSSIAAGTTVDITLNITNNSDDDYDGTLLVGRKIGSGDNASYSFLTPGNFIIPAHTTKDCVLTYTPDDPGTYNLVFFFPNQQGSFYTDGVVKATLTVTAGSANPTTDNIDLTSSLVVDTQEEVSGYSGYYFFYGSTLKGNLTITNPQSSNYYGQYLCRVYDYNGWEVVYEYNDFTSVPANGSITIPIEVSGISNGENFVIIDNYIKNGGWAYENSNQLGSFKAQPGVVKYNADGTSTLVKATPNFEVEDGVMAVNLTGSGVTSVTKNSEPNCLYIVGSDETVPAGLTNVITYDGDSYTASNITLTDGNGFYSPVDFTAANIEFTYTHTTAADGTNGWNSIILPFDVAQVTADNVPIDWFHGSADSGKNFWLKSFTGDESNSVYFDYVEGPMKANTPYIVAFPGNTWGEKWNMSNKTIRFIGTDAEVQKSGGVTSATGANYRFIGSTMQDDTHNIYCLNTSGNAFELVQTAGSGPFRAYFKPGTFDLGVTRLSIAQTPSGTTALDKAVKVSDADDDAQWYTVDGRRLSVKPAAKGVYIVNGNKVVVK